LAQHSLISDAVVPAVQGAHMTYPPDRHPASCVIAEVQPLLAELRDDIGMQLADTAADRASMQRYIRDVFRHTKTTKHKKNNPQQHRNKTEQSQHNKDGFRDGLVRPLFSEHYL